MAPTEDYPLNVKNVTIFGEKVTLRELPSKYIIDVEKGNIEDSIIGTCLAGSNASQEIVDQLGYNQIQAMYNDIMILSYGKDWKKKAEEATPSKKK